MTKYTQTFEVRENECNTHYQLRLGSMWDYFQNIASKHADSLGFGFTDMKERGFYWMLNRMSAVISRYPRYEELVKVTTNPAGISGLFAVREYHIYDQSENELVRACGMFIVVDAKTFRPQKPSVYGDAHPIFSVEYTGDLPYKIAEPQNLTYSRDFRAEYSDIDVNKHTNNARYISWIENLLVPQIGDKQISQLCANYIHEIKLGESMKAFQSGDLVELRNSEEKPVFRCEVKYR